MQQRRKAHARCPVCNRALDGPVIRLEGQTIGRVCRCGRKWQHSVRQSPGKECYTAGRYYLVRTGDRATVQ